MSRSRLWRVLALSLAVIVVTALVVAIATVAVSVNRPIPERNGAIAVPGLSAEVEVLRDARGVPSIYADTAEDLFIAQGYVHAQDRFFQMDLRRHYTAGRLAELLGDSDFVVGRDILTRTLGWRRVAEAELEQLDPTNRSYLDAYADGVNAYLAERSPGQLSLAYPVIGLQVPQREIEPWTAVDSLAWLKALAWDLNANFGQELDRAVLLAAGETPERVAELFPPYDAEQNRPVVPSTAGEVNRAVRPSAAIVTALGEPSAVEALAATSAMLQTQAPLVAAEARLGSNGWVVSGEHTASGDPILANDPHLGAESPSTWYQVGLHCRTVDESCPFDVSGVSFAGLPGVFIGHNADIAWGLAHLYADQSDFALERVVDD